MELATDPEITSPNVHAVPTATPTEGVGTVEAPRGTLTHHYWTDERGIVTKVNLIVGTTNNYAPISDVDPQGGGEPDPRGTIVTEGLLNRVEMAFRLYDPVLRLRHPLAARADAAGSHHPRSPRATWSTSSASSVDEP